MNIKLAVLRQLKRSLDQKFLFIPCNSSFFSTYIDICVEFFSQKDVPSPVSIKVIDELIDRRVLAPQKERRFRYDFQDFSFHDFYLVNYDGRIYSRGFSADIHEATAKALGEIFERQALESPGEGSVLLHSSIKELKDQNKVFAHPKSYPQPTVVQVAMFSDTFTYDESTSFAWVEAKALSNGKSVYILAQDAHWGFGYEEDEPRMVNQGTNGCGGGYTYEQAFNSALFELVQRDAFFRFWYTKKSPSSIELDSIPQTTKTAKMVHNLQKEGFEVHLLDLSKEAGVPTVVAVLKRTQSGWFLGASSSFSKESSAYRALEEAFSVYMWTFQQSISGAYDISSFVKNSARDNFLEERINGKERCLLWGSEFYLEKQDKFLVMGEQIQFKEVGLDKEFDLKQFLLTKFGEGYVVESKEKLLEDYSFFSIKVSFPSMYSLILSEKHARPVLGNTYPQNTSPHPFP